MVTSYQRINDSIFQTIAERVNRELSIANHLHWKNKNYLKIKFDLDHLDTEYRRYYELNTPLFLKYFKETYNKDIQVNHYIAHSERIEPNPHIHYASMDGYGVLYCFLTGGLLFVVFGVYKVLWVSYVYLRYKNPTLFPPRVKFEVGIETELK